MASRNLPLFFVELLAAGLLIDHGAKAVAATLKGGGGGGAGSVATGPASSAVLPGVVRWERTDQGVDAAASPGSAVNALVAGTVTKIDPNWYQGQPAVYVSSPGLPGGADGIYYAEQLLPNVKVGDQVQAGQKIGTVAPSGTGLEIGLAKGGSTLAQATTGYVEGGVTHAGELMRQLLASAGVKGL